MALNPNIILSGQPIDIVGSMARGTQAAGQALQLRDQNALRNVYQTQGAGLLNGDPGAMNALAAIDPNAAIGMRNSHLDGQYAQQRMDILSRDEQRQLDEFKANASAQQKAEAAAKIEEAVRMGLAITNEAQWDAVMGQQAPELVGQFANKQAYAMKYMTMAEALKAVEPPKPQAPYTTQGKLKADLDAGRIGQEEYQAGLAALAPKGTSITFDPASGAMTYNEGAGVAGNGATKVGDVISAAGVDETEALIEDILKTDKGTMDRITGSLMGGGGNNIDELSGAKRYYYGDDGVATIEKLGQLGSKAWFAARDMLKGGGPITDYESRKAEGAVARLSRAKGPEALTAALEELLGAIRDGKEKLRAAGRLAPATGAAPVVPAAPGADVSDEDLLKMYGG